jgi:hypothetical protein
MPLGDLLTPVTSVDAPSGPEPRPDTDRMKSRRWRWFDLRFPARGPLRD